MVSATKARRGGSRSRQNLIWLAACLEMDTEQRASTLKQNGAVVSPEPTKLAKKGRQRSAKQIWMKRRDDGLDSRSNVIAILRCGAMHFK